jgi:hypothetical protein
MALRTALAGAVLAAALLVAGVGRDQLAVLSSTVVQGRCAWRSCAARASILPCMRPAADTQRGQVGGTRRAVATGLCAAGQ